MRYHVLASVALAMMLTSAVAPSASAGTAPCPRTAQQANELRVVADDAGFHISGNLTAGVATIRLTNHGTVPHIFDLYRLVPGGTVGQLVQAASSGDYSALDALLADGGPGNGNPNIVGPGRTAVATGDGLRAGTYAAVDGLPGRDGRPNFLHGLAATVTVSAGSSPEPTPASDGRVVVDDTSVHLPAALASGHGTFAVDYRGLRPHEFQLLRLDDDATVPEAFAYWGAVFAGGLPVGGSPAKFVGGLADLRPGVHGWVTLDLPPGRYGVWSVVDGDSTDVENGVFTTFTVRS